MEHLLSISQIFSILKHSETVEGEYGAQTKEPKLTHNSLYNQIFLFINQIFTYTHFIFSYMFHIWGFTCTEKGQEIKTGSKV